MLLTKTRISFRNKLMRMQFPVVHYRSAKQIRQPNLRYCSLIFFSLLLFKNWIDRFSFPLFCILIALKEANLFIHIFFFHSVQCLYLIFVSNVAGLDFFLCKYDCFDFIKKKRSPSHYKTFWGTYLPQSFLF